MGTSSPSTSPNSLAVSRAKQCLLAAAIVGAQIGTFLAITPPNPDKEGPSAPAAAAGDLLRRIGMASSTPSRIVFGPHALLALHQSILAYLHPRAPAGVVRHGVANGLNPRLLTWSSATAVPLALICCVGVPLRLVPYASLGTNFTFALAEPDRLVTSGIYRYVQHPSYLGLLALAIGEALLVMRPDGPLSCWIPPRWHAMVRKLLLVAMPAWVATVAVLFSLRIAQEERMMRARFGAEWERWHAATARFIPFIF